MLKATGESARGQAVLTQKGKERAARKWVKAAIAYGLNPHIFDFKDRYAFRFEEPNEPKGRPHPGPYDSSLKAEVRAELARLGRISDHR